MRFSQATLRRSRVACENRIARSEEHTSELQSRLHLVCRLLLEKKKHTNELQSRLHLVCRLLLGKTKSENELHQYTPPIVPPSRSPINDRIPRRYATAEVRVRSV